MHYSQTGLIPNIKGWFGIQISFLCLYFLGNILSFFAQLLIGDCLSIGFPFLSLAAVFILTLLSSSIFSAHSHDFRSYLYPNYATVSVLGTISFLPKI